MEEFYKKKIIRDFLTLFSESKWKNLCILCMEYGVLTLKQKYQVSSLSMEDIEEFVNGIWVLRIGDWRLHIRHRPQSPITNHQSPIPNPQSPLNIISVLSIIIK